MVHILLINFRKASDSTVDNGCISSMTYSESKLSIFWAGMEFLVNVHCLFGSLSSVSMLLCRFFSDFSTSFATNLILLCIVFRYFLKLEVEFLADESVLLPPHNVQCTLIFLESSLTTLK